MSKLSDRQYFAKLNAIVDQIFIDADEVCDYTWTQLADAAGVGTSTVYNLGNRQTQRPQLRTVLRLAEAVGLEFVLRRHAKQKRKAA